MHSLTEIFASGGVTTYVILLLTFLGMGGSLVMGVAGLFGKRVPLPLWLFLPMAIVGAGIGGTASGMMEVTEALAYVAPGSRGSLVMRGTALAAIPLWLASFGACVLLGLSAAAAGVGAMTKLGERRWTPASAGLGTLGALAALAVVVGGGLASNVGGVVILGGLILMLVALGVLLANLSTGDDEHEPRVASIRLGVALMGALAAFCWGVGSHHFIMNDVFNAIELATPENRMRLLAYGLEASSKALLLGTVAAAILMLSGAAANATRVLEALDGRGIAGAVIAALFSLVILGSNSAYEEIAQGAIASSIPTSALAMAAKTELPAQPEQTKSLGKQDANPSCILHHENNQWVLASGWAEDLPDGCGKNPSGMAGLEDRFVQIEVSEEGDAIDSALEEEGCPSSSGVLKGTLCRKTEVTLIAAGDDPIGPFLEHPWAHNSRSFSVLLKPSALNIPGDSWFVDAVRWSAHPALPITWLRLPPVSPEQEPLDNFYAIERVEGGWVIQSMHGKADVAEKELTTALSRAGVSTDTDIALIPNPKWTFNRTLEVCAELTAQFPTSMTTSAYSYGGTKTTPCILLAATPEQTRERLVASRAPAENDPTLGLGLGKIGISGTTGADGDLKMLGGKIDAGDVAKRLARTNTKITTCYKRALKSDPKASGKVTVLFVIGTAGRVTMSKATLDEVGHGTGACVAETIKRLRFVKPEGGAVNISKTFSFGAPGSESKPARVTASTDGGQPQVMGSLDKDVIRRVVRKNTNQIRYCYERELAKNPNLSGKVNVKFVVSGTGKVSSATVASSTLSNAAVESCITQKIRRWRFPEPKGGGIVIINYPFSFAAK